MVAMIRTRASPVDLPYGHATTAAYAMVLTCSLGWVPCRRTWGRGRRDVRRRTKAQTAAQDRGRTRRRRAGARRAGERGGQQGGRRGRGRGGPRAAAAAVRSRGPLWTVRRCVWMSGCWTWTRTGCRWSRCVRLPYVCSWAATCRYLQLDVPAARVSACAEAPSYLPSSVLKAAFLLSLEVQCAMSLLAVGSCPNNLILYHLASSLHRRRTAPSPRRAR